TDGNENTGNLYDEVEAAAAGKVGIDVVPLQYQHDAEILFDRISVPAHATRDTKIPLRFIIKSRRPTRARLSLYHNNTEVPLADPDLKLDGGMQPNPFTIPVELQGGGVHRFDARLTPLSPTDDAVIENNQATAFTFVSDQGRVLILTPPGSRDDLRLVDALKREQIDVALRGVDQVNIDLLALQEYSAVVLANISADTFNSEQHKALASYVRDFGGGLVMTGGNEGFGAGGWIGTPVEEISPVAFEVKQKKIIPRGALAIIMHSCEIPKGNYWGEQVALATVDTISSLDYLGVICYSFRVGGPNWDVPMAPVADKSAVKSKIKQMQIGDMPDFDSTMRLATQALMAKKDASQRHMIIISDGDPSPPSAATIGAMQDNGITCSTVGIGYGVHCIEQTLRDIATKTKGRFYAAKDLNRLPQIFVKEAKVVRRPLIDNQEFRPQLVFNFAQTTQGISPNELPPLGGLVLTEAKPDSLVPIIRRGRDGDDPVLAHWNYEMGKMVAFTSGWWTNWGTDWVAWDKFGKLWAQVLRWAMRQEASADFDVLTRMDGNTGRVVVEALDKDASYLNFLSFNGRLLTPTLEQKKIYLTQTGPGRYEGQFDITDHGNYLINLQYNTPDRQMGMIRTGLSLPYSPEFRELGTNLSLLNRVVDRTGGKMFGDMDPEKNDIFRRDLPPVVARQPVWRWVVAWLLLPLFLLDVAGRRLASTVAMSVYVEVAVFVVACAALQTARAPAWAYLGALLLAEVVGWSIRYRSIMPTIQFFTSGAVILARVGQRSRASLEQLKDVSEKVREDLDSRRATQKEADTIPLEPAADRRRRFDVGDEAAAQPAKDLAETLGEAAARADERLQQPDAERKPGQPPAGQPQDLTSRLLKAKKRVQDELDKREKEE
ncbi:MAG TPA: glutamine amidotransferase, partial [Phycisphaerae bacterium]|nr:glutamine amidotransferase [Phycisphaerae bacterium]